jgi:hypothetical protein
MDDLADKKMTGSAVKILEEIPAVSFSTSWRFEFCGGKSGEVIRGYDRRSHSYQ